MTELTAPTHPRIFWHARNPKRLHLSFQTAHFLLCTECGGAVAVTHLVPPDQVGWLPSFRVCLCFKREVKHE